MSDPAVPNDASELESDLAEEHVVEILFDSGAEFEADCLLCEAATRLGIWQRYGFDPGASA